MTTVRRTNIYHPSQNVVLKKLGEFIECAATMVEDMAWEALVVEIKGHGNFASLGKVFHSARCMLC